MGSEMCIRDRSQCKVSDTQVTVKACGPLVFKKDTILAHGRLFKRSLKAFAIPFSFFSFFFGGGGVFGMFEYLEYVRN